MMMKKLFGGQQMKKASILLVDDEPALLHMLKKVLNKEGFRDIDTAATGEQAVEACRRKPYDLIVLDVMLPGQSGFEICPQLRQYTEAPILFLTSRSSDLDTLSGFSVGGDDYVTKPFNPLEVAARVKVWLKRSRKQHTSQLTRSCYDFGRFRVDETAAELYVEDQRVSCPAQVFHLLLFFCKHPNRVFQRQELYERVWGADSVCDDNTVMVHISRIRERIERDPSRPDYLVTVRGIGYKLLSDGDRQT
jgi:two-component system, OmpR family, response regulator RegX3